MGGKIRPPGFTYVLSFREKLNSVRHSPYIPHINRLVRVDFLPVLLTSECHYFGTW
jgi:hypothetical protein